MRTLANRIRHDRPGICSLLTVTALLLATVGAHARGGGRCYGVSSSSAGRGNVYNSSRGGSAYVGPRGVAAQGPEGRTAVATPRGAAYSGPNGAAVSSRYGAAATGPNGTAVVGRNGAAYAGANGAVVAARPVAGGYYTSSIPAGARVAYYGGYNCYYVGGIYYRPVYYGGSLVYTVVNP